MKMAIRRVHLASLSKFGCLLGAVVAFVPSLLCGLIALGLAALLRHWLEAWQEVTISLLGQEVARLDLVQLLELRKVLAVAQGVTSASLPVLFLVVLGLALAGGVLLAVLGLLAGLCYNLLASATGGLVVEMAALQEIKAPRLQADSGPARSQSSTGVKPE